MKVLLLFFNMPELIMPTLPLGIVSVATAVQQAGHDVKILELASGGDFDKLVADTIVAFAPDAIGISVRNIDDQCMRETRFLLEPLKAIVACCRRLSKAPIILGGAGYSMYPEVLLDWLGADIGIKGDGEAALPAVLDHLRMGVDPAMIKGVYVKGRSPFKKICSILDLNKLPQPDPALWPCPAEGRGDVWLPFQTRRGCPLACSYCSTASIEGTALRKRDPKTVAEHIGRHVEAGFRRFYCTDNTFNLPVDYARELCRALADAALPITWSCIVYPYKIAEGLVADMARAGCVEVALGFESGSPAILKSMRKRFSLEDVRQAAGLFKKHSIKLNGYLLLGAPGETRETVLESLAFADSLPFDFLKISTGIRIYPDTELARIAAAEGVIAAGDDLLMPLFYLAGVLDGWIQDEIARWTATRPHWQG
jgi:radical SAM superfamily enzyme YgiQ (UPF0313 family)